MITLYEAAMDQLAELCQGIENLVHAPRGSVSIDRRHRSITVWIDHPIDDVPFECLAKAIDGVQHALTPPGGTDLYRINLKVMGCP